MKKAIRTLTTTLVLTTLLLTPTLPAWATGAPVPGLFGWVQGWVQTAMSWVTGEAASAEEVGPRIDPLGLQNDGGPGIDPWGLQSDVGPGIDPAGFQATGTGEGDGDSGPSIEPLG